MTRRNKAKGTGRDGGRFVALPSSVLDSAAYLNLSMHARALLVDVAHQFDGANNGRLLLTRDVLAARGWSSSDVIHKAKGELLANRLIFETAIGQRPHKAGWYAMTWYALDRMDGFDAGAALTFERGAYRTVARQQATKRDTSAATAARREAAAGRRSPKAGGPQILRPSDGLDGPSIAPSHGLGKAAARPSDGAIKAISGGPPRPSDGHHLDVAISRRAPTPAAVDDTA